jgi:hypothetical protein
MRTSATSAAPKEDVRSRLWRSLASQLVLVQLILIPGVLVAVSAVSVEQARRQF